MPGPSTLKNEKNERKFKIKYEVEDSNELVIDSNFLNSIVPEDSDSEDFFVQKKPWE